MMRAVLNVLAQVWLAVTHYPGRLTMADRNRRTEMRIVRRWAP
jgi:hypothetical protein